jgi:RNA polymerase sigma-70 factor (ECF subfamily)
VDQAEFETLLRQTWPTIVAVARRFHAGAEVADICQEVVLIAWRRRDTLRDISAFASWVRTIALNVGRSHSRRRQSWVGVLEEQQVSLPDMSEDILNRQAVEDALSALSKRERFTVEAHYVTGWPLSDIAGALGEPVGTTKARLSRARSKLRRELRRVGWNRLGRSERKEHEDD